MRRELVVVLLVGCLNPVSVAAESPEAIIPIPAAPASCLLADTVETSGEASPTTCGAFADGRWAVGLDYVLWWLGEARLPPVLTTSSAASQGVLGRSDTKLLYGGDRLQTRHGDRFNGVRPTVGYWLDDEHVLGIEGSAFFLERDSTYFKATSTGNVLLARSYVNAQTGGPATEVVAGPGPSGTLNGGFVGYSRVELFGEEVNLTMALGQDEGFRLDLLAGARFLQMRSRTDLTSTGRFLPDQATLVGLTDHFRADDQFYGGQVGLRGEFRRGPWILDLRGAAALGGDEQQVRAFGDRTFQTPLVKVVQQFGLFVQPSNRGTYHRADLDSVFEVVASVGYRVSRHLRLFVGYTFLAWVNPVRSGDQIDPAVSLSQSTGRLAVPDRPAIPFREDFFWAQGVNAGLHVHW
jgi:hypothetical protein